MRSRRSTSGGPVQATRRPANEGVTRSRHEVESPVEGFSAEAVPLRPEAERSADLEREERLRLMTTRRAPRLPAVAHDRRIRRTLLALAAVLVVVVGVMAVLGRTSGPARVPEPGAQAAAGRVPHPRAPGRGEVRAPRSSVRPHAHLVAPARPGGGRAPRHKVPSAGPPRRGRQPGPGARSRQPPPRQRGVSPEPPAPEPAVRVAPAPSYAAPESPPAEPSPESTAAPTPEPPVAPKSETEPPPSEEHQPASAATSDESSTKRESNTVEGQFGFEH